MKNIVLFDQDTQHYRQSIYRYFREELKKTGYNLIVVYDRNLNTIKDENWIIGIDYSFFSFLQVIEKFNSKITIQFVWLRYKFLIPFMLWAKLNGVKIILWSHGINLQNKNQIIINQLYYLRQLLANALIIYTPNQKQFIKVSHEKLFVANNTLNFTALPKITSEKKYLKQKYFKKEYKTIICIGRMNVNNRKIKQLINLSKLLDPSYRIVIVGPGVSEQQKQQISENENINYLGAIYDQKVICELYKMADLFIMPGAIGLAINQAFYFGTPVLLEDVEQGPEAYYLKNGVNGYYYETNNLEDLYSKVKLVFSDRDYYRKLSNSAKNTIETEGAIEKMYEGFKNAIRYVEK